MSLAFLSLMLHQQLVITANIPGQQLKNDLEKIILKHQGAVAMEVIAESPFGGLQTVRVYEIQESGTVITTTNDTNHFEEQDSQEPNGKFVYSAMVAYLGFQKNSPVERALNDDVLALENHYLK